MYLQIKTPYTDQSHPPQLFFIRRFPR